MTSQITPLRKDLKSLSQSFGRKSRESAKLGERLQDLEHFMNEAVAIDNSKDDRNLMRDQVDVRGPKEVRMPYFGPRTTTSIKLETSPEGQSLSHYSIAAPEDVSTTHEPEPENDYVVGTRNVYSLDSRCGRITHTRTSFEHKLERVFEEVWDPTFGYHREFENDPVVATDGGTKISEERLLLDLERGTITYL
jgi:hypothetical protein